MFWAVIFGVIMIVLLLSIRDTRSGGANYARIPLSDFYNEINRGSVSRVALDGDEVTGAFSAPVLVGGRSILLFRSALPQGTAGNWLFTQWLLGHGGVTVEVESSNSLVTNFVLPFIPWLVIFFFIWFFVFRQLRSRSTPVTPMPVIIMNPEGR